MTRRVGTIMVNNFECVAGLDSFRSLAEALAQLEFEGPLEVAWKDDCLTYQGQPMAKLSSRKRCNSDGLVIMVSLTPTFLLPQMVVDLQARVPALRVDWVEGWPIYSANPGDGHDEDQLPVLPCGELLP